MEYNYFWNLSKVRFILDTKNRFVQEKNFSNAPSRQIVFAFNTNTTCVELLTGNPFCNQNSYFRQVRLLRGVQSVVDFEEANQCLWFVTKTKAMNFQDEDDVPSFPTVKQNPA